MSEGGAKRSLRLDFVDCQALSASDEGAAALVDPGRVKKSSKDPNRGLYPRPSRSASAGDCSAHPMPTFQTASSLLRSNRAREACSSQNGTPDGQARLQASGDGSPAPVVPKGRSEDPGPSRSAPDCGGSAARPMPTFQSASLLRRSNHAADNAPSNRRRRHETQDNKITGYFRAAPQRKRQRYSESTESSDSPEEEFVGEVPRLPSKLPVSVPPVDWGDSDSSSSSDSVVITEVFGLLPAPTKKKEEPKLEDPFGRLPVELLETVLAHVGLQDLLLVCTRVCVRWNEVIRNPLFLPQRKRYYRYKTSRCKVTSAEVVALCNSQGMRSAETCLPGLVRYMAGFKQSMRGLPKAIRSHPKHETLMEVLQGSFADVFPLSTKDAPDQAPWWCAVAALVVLVADSVSDIRALFRHADPVALSEALYCVATLMLYFQRALCVHHGIHYRIYYALHLSERAWQGTAADVAVGAASRAGQQSLHQFGLPNQRVRFTHEQMRIIHHELKPTDVVRIVAFAGTGKTSTLVEYARLRPALRFLCIVYNRSVCEIAKQTFPSNVECRTAHSLAFRAVGFRYQKKLTANLRVLDVVKLLTEQEQLSQMPRLRLARLVLSTVESFLASKDAEMSTAHVPYHVVVDNREDGEVLAVRNSDRNVICEIAQRLWRRMCNSGDAEARMTHDGYLKLFQLRKPRLGAYDAIFVDEAQDCNPAMLSLVLSQPCAKLLVGDPNQQIYAFRGAIDALSTVPSTHTFSLTQSFRFGPEISFVASCILEVHKGVFDKTIVGGEQPGTILGSTSGQVAIIARSNLTLFNMAVEIVCNGGHVEYGLSHVNGAFVGGLSGYGIQQILDIYHLKHSAGPVESVAARDPFVKRFASFQRLQAYAKAAGDLDLCSRLAFVDLHGERVPQYVRTLQLRCSGDQRLANIVFSTVHKAKGLEFDSVCLADDFFGTHLSEQEESMASGRLEEYNILYVAITRARKCLRLSPFVYYSLLLAQECFEQIQLRKDEFLACVVCGLAFEPKGRLVWSRTPLYVGKQSVRGGPLCRKCALETSWRPPVEHQFRNLWESMMVGHRIAMAPILNDIL